MKKKLVKLASVMLLAAMTFSFSGCGSEKKESTKEETTKEESKEEKDSESSDKLYDSVEEFVNSEELQTQLTSLKETLTGSGMGIEIKAEGDTLVYEYTYDELTTDDTTLSDMKTQLDTALEQQAATFQAVATELKNSTGAKDPVVKIVYIDAAGKEITSKEFKAQ